MRSHDLYIFSLFLGALNVLRGKTCFSQLEEDIARCEDHCSAAVTMAATKEETTLLPNSSSATKAKTREERYPVSRAFCILHLLAFALLVCWLTLLTCQSWRPKGRVMLPEEMIRQLVTSQEVRDPRFSSKHQLLSSGS